MDRKFPARPRENGSPVAGATSARAMQCQCHATRVLGAALAILAILAASPAWPQAQAHQREFGPYVLQSSTVGSQNISEESARKYGIQRNPQRAILNVTVLARSDGVEKTVPAKVQAIARDMTERKRKIAMRETVAGGRVSYVGTYDFVPGEVLEFAISAQPEGSSDTLSMTYQQQMWGK